MGNNICFIFLIIFATFTAMALARPQDSVSSCGPNGQDTSCGSACPPRCGDNPLESAVCIAVCVAGCQCNPGYLLNDAGRCVLSSEC
ncbi:PREDICTED: chymotrypsin inhibitor [Bactrocera latifrons]|uniref:chymotrypsin inhibitor n=1 Tax=Bactrocera latifrons TaxID=174628 RepID=UPI0008DD251D|nr:PREDICTED: chymotrypsin inhibitor [Bactrocera latifrons]